jgi:phage terminase large subunit
MVRQIHVDYEPNAKQALFHMSDAEELVYGGAKGGGKSCAIVMEALAYALEYPTCKIYLFRETYDDLEANLISEMKEKWPKELYKYNDSKHVATLTNGSRVFFRFISSEKDAKRYQGRSMDFVGVDELTNFDKDWIRILLSCLRSPKGFPPRFRGTCNPGGRGHAWVKNEYVTGTNYGENILTNRITGGKIQFIAARVYDNVVLMENDPNYVKRLEDLPENEKRAYLYGDWDIFAGQYFTAWRHEKHVIDPFEIPEHWKKWRAIDWGFNDHCSIGWYAADEDGHVFKYRQLYIRETLASDIAKMVVKLTGKEKIRYTVAGHDCWQKRGNDHTQGESIAETFGLNGVPLEMADISRVVGWHRLKEYLQDAPDEKPWFQVFSTCADTIRTIPVMIYSSKRVEDMDDTLEDHAVDETRYSLMSRPIKSKELDPELSVVSKHKQRLIKKRQTNMRRAH